MKTRTFLTQMACDDQGEVSSKRLAFLYIVISLSVALFVSAFTQVTFNEALIEALSYIAITCVGAGAAEKFSKRKQPPVTHETPPEPYG
jgi:hypothetical protein